jgi:hypothetical protein
MKKINSIVTILIFITFSSCTAYHEIIVREDGSANANLYMNSSDKAIMDSYYQIEIISNIDTNSIIAGCVLFKINNIDSLGNYLPLHPPGFFRFSMKGDTLFITDGHTNAFKHKDLFCCGVTMLIKFEKDIHFFESSNRHVRLNDKNTIMINKTRTQLIKGKKRIAVKIVLVN